MRNQEAASAASFFGSKGNAGVAASVQQALGSIGYVEYAYARQSNLVYTDAINMADQRVEPALQTFQAARRMPFSLRCSQTRVSP